MSFESDLSQFIRENKFKADPLGYVMTMFPWKTDESIQKVKLPEEYHERFPGFEWGPDRWACEFLDDLGKEIRERKFTGKKAVAPVRFSTASGHGIGKSTMSAWLVMYILDTRPMANIIVTANTGEQLRTKTWAAVAQWHSKCLSKPLWEITTGRGAMSVYRKHGDAHVKANWRADGQVCRPENSEAFQGLHAVDSTACFIFDEASGIDDAIYAARSGAASDGEPMWFDWGNPTRKSGYFFENTVGEYKHRYNTRSIDSRSCQIPNKEMFQEWIDDYGLDSDFVKVKVLGQFPSAGSVQFIETDIVNEAMRRDVYRDTTQGCIIGVDVARFGENATVIYPRIGNDARSFKYKLYRELDGWQVADKVVQMIQELQAIGITVGSINVDGGGLGSSPIDKLRYNGYNPIDVSFAHRAGDGKYARKGDEMWGEMRDALAAGLALPFDMELKKQLTQREYGFTEMTGKIKLESKETMEKLKKESPDIADALALTYHSKLAADVLPRGQRARPKFARHDYDPYRI